MTRNWTLAQQNAIDARDQNVLVSAGAGAGKTATLVERVYRLITDPRDPVSLESMLIVTFTRAAAAEMRERLGEQLRHALNEAFDSNAPEETIRRLRSQLILLPRAPISTLHSFCMQLLREHAEKVNLPPDFDLMAEEEAYLQRGEWIDDAIEACVEEPECGEILREILEQLPPAFGTEAVATIVRRLHHFLEAMPDPKGYTTRVLEDYRRAGDASVPWSECMFGREIVSAIKEPLERTRQALDVFFRTAPNRGFKANWTQKYWDRARQIDQSIEAFLESLDDDIPLPDFKEFLKLESRRSLGKTPDPTDAALSEAGQLLKPPMDAARDELGKLVSEPSVRAMRHQVAACASFVELLLGKLGNDLCDEILTRHIEQRRLTFAHLERLALKLLTDSNEASRLLRERFEHVLVDEFQDVNALQAQLLRAIARPGTEENASPGNLFVVGDVKQSIYGFRQADPRQFQELYARYHPYGAGKSAQPGARISLRENFRTAPALLRELNRFFAALFTRELGGIEYDTAHQFIPGRQEFFFNSPRLEFHLIEQQFDWSPAPGDGDDSDGDGDADVLSEANEREAQYVAERIRDLNVPWGDVAVLLRSASGTATKLIEAFQRVGIPYHTEESIGFLTQQEVRDVLALLRVIDNPYQEVALVGCLRGPVGQWTENDLVHLRLVNREGLLFDNLKHAAQANGHLLEFKTQKFLERLRHWQHASQRESMEILFARLYDEMHWRERAAVLPNGDQRVANLLYLQERGVQFDSFRRKGLTRFLRFIDDLIERGEDLGQPAAAPPNANVVRVMTMHKSKGLQFPIVIVPFMGRSFNMKDSMAPVLWDAERWVGTQFTPGGKYGDGQTSVARQLLVEPIRTKSRSEELRLLYVAMTRAEERLLLFGSERNALNRLQEIQALTELPNERRLHINSANSPLDWALLALSEQGEFRSFGQENPIVSTGGDRVVFHLVEETGTESVLRPQESPSDDAAFRERLQSAVPEFNQAVEHIAHLANRQIEPPLRAKVSATEAKRVYESLHSEENPPARPAVAYIKKSEKAEPEWWPASLTEQPKTRSGGRRVGTLTHRLCALLDLEAVKNGILSSEQLDRLTHDGFFTEDEAAMISTKDIDNFFRDPELGQRVVRAHATAQREIPFTVRLDAGELEPNYSVPNEGLLFQGVVDLMFREPTRNGTGEQIILVDFKTDYWDGTSEHFFALEEAYRSQMILYRVGMERALGTPVAETWLYFLRASQPIKVNSPTDEEEWLRYLRDAYKQLSP